MLIDEHICIYIIMIIYSYVCVPEEQMRCMNEKFGKPIQTGKWKRDLSRLSQVSKVEKAASSRRIVYSTMQKEKYAKNVVWETKRSLAWRPHSL